MICFIKSSISKKKSRRTFRNRQLFTKIMKHRKQEPLFTAGSCSISETEQMYRYAGKLLRLAVAAKLKCKTSLTDVSFAVTEAELLAEPDYNIWDNERDVNDFHFSFISISYIYLLYFYCLINSVHFSHIQFIHIYIPICKQLNTL